MSSGIYEGKPFNEEQLKGIARWILEESSSPMDELHDLLFDSMYNHPKVFEITWEDIVEENDLKKSVGL